MNIFFTVIALFMIAVRLTHPSEVDESRTDQELFTKAVQDEQTELRRLFDLEIEELKSALRLHSEQISSLQASIGVISRSLGTHVTNPEEKGGQLTCAVQQDKTCTAHSRGISVPRVWFTHCFSGVGKCSDVSIEKGGATVTDMAERRANWVNVRTNGLLMGRQYWEVKYSWIQLSGRYEWRFVGAVGVRREGSDFSGFRDDQLWTVAIWYLFEEKVWEYRCVHDDGVAVRDNEDGKPSTRVKYEDGSTVTNRLGFLLETNGTLTVVEVNSGARICSFPNVKVDRQVVPVVSFGTYEFQRTFRLVEVNPSRLPEPICSVERSQQDVSQQLIVPQLRFTERFLWSRISWGEVDFMEYGMLVKDSTDQPAVLICVRTNGLMTGVKYWEVKLTWSKVSGRFESWRVGAVGARQSGTNFRQYPGFDYHSWAVSVNFLLDNNTWVYQCLHKSETLSQTKREIYEEKSVVVNRLGLLLKSANRTLTIIDLKNNTPICTFTNVTDQVVVPVVGFGRRYFRKSFRLLAVDPNQLPESVRALI